MVPLWLVFRNADPDAPNVYVIFKSGDDLRQDILTLQILSLMDGLWLSSGLDLKMKPYKCIATGVNEHNEGVGLIEVVLNSDTTSGIQLKYGGGAVGALKMDPLDLFLREHNKIAKDYGRWHTSTHTHNAHMLDYTLQRVSVCLTMVWPSADTLLLCVILSGLFLCVSCPSSREGR